MKNLKPHLKGEELEIEIRKAKRIIYFVNMFYIDKIDDNQSEDCIKKRAILKAKQQAISLIYENTLLSVTKIGKLFDDLDHSSVSHSKKVVINDCLYPLYQTEFNAISEGVKKFLSIKPIDYSI